MPRETEPLFRNDDPSYEPKESRIGRWFRWFVYAFVGICAAGVAVWALSGKPERPPPVISGAQAPDRAAPDADPNRVPHQDQPIYERLSAGSDPGRGQELMPAAEAPLSREQLAAAVRQPAEPLPEPAPAPAETAADGQTAALPPPLDIPPPSAPESLPESEPAPEARPALPSSVVKPEDAQETGFRIQIASVRTEEQAEAEWARVASRHPELLGRLSGIYPTHDAGARGTFVRVQAGPLIDKALAELLCSQLKARKVECLVVEP